MPQAVPRYSPVGSKASVHPNSGASSRMVPPVVGAPEADLAPEVPPARRGARPQADVDTAPATPRRPAPPNAAPASRLRPITDFTPFVLSPQTSSARVIRDWTTSWLRPLSSP